MLCLLLEHAEYGEKTSQQSSTNGQEQIGVVQPDLPPLQNVIAYSPHGGVACVLAGAASPGEGRGKGWIDECWIQACLGAYYNRAEDVGDFLFKGGDRARKLLGHEVRNRVLALTFVCVMAMTGICNVSDLRYVVTIYLT